MGVKKGVSMKEFPKQGTWVGKRCEVCFNYDTSNTIMATCVREDMTEPGLCIFKLDDGRYVLSTECQHTMPR